jgi:hypothetical protein
MTSIVLNAPETIRASLPDAALEWLDETLLNPDFASKYDVFLARARRKAGQESIQPVFSLASNKKWPSSNQPDVAANAAHWGPQNWDASDGARILLLHHLLTSGLNTFDPPHPELKTGAVSSGNRRLLEAYKVGDEKERCAILKGLLLLDPEAKLQATAVDAGRTNSLEVFSALAVGNPYPYLYYSEAEFNQLVLKALFLELDLKHVFGLSKRLNQPLVQMCTDFAEERRAAGRSVPESIKLVLEWSRK